MNDFSHSVFAPKSGVEEHFFAGTASPGDDFITEAEALFGAFDAATARYGCCGDELFLLRLHLSDPANQCRRLAPLLAGRKGYVSIVGQPPVEGGRIALEAWFRHGSSSGAFPPFWFGTSGSGTGSYEQTRHEFSALREALALWGRTVRENCVRTWIYCRDVDNNYSGLVRGRNDFFAANGIDRNSGFITSTGIEGISEEPSRLIKMDSLCFSGLKREQRIFLSAPEMLSPTTRYGVSFERGVRLIFGDRSHYYISGTASIDRDGKVLYENDVAGQTRRMIDNIEALLESSEGKLKDLRWGTVYLRDAADASTVRRELEKRLSPELPLVIVRAPVCRPAWLVEMEGVAINGRGGAFEAL